MKRVLLVASLSILALVPKVYDALRQGPTDALSSDAFRELNAAIKQSKA